MIRTVIIPTDTTISIPIPEEYVGKPVEVTFFALDEVKEESQNTMLDFWGVISDQTAETLHRQVEQNRNGWDSNI